MTTAESTTWDAVLQSFREEREVIAQGGGAAAVAKQHAKQRLTARERIAALIDPGTEFWELGRWSAWKMYLDWGSPAAAGVVCGLARVAGRTFMVIANDATVKAGAFFPMTAKKVLRMQRIALVNRIPIIYLVDSAGVFLPLQDEVFPDEDDFGRIFRNNAVLSAMGVGQLAAILGNCVAGGGYLPVLCDKIVMTDGSGLYLAGPALVKSSIGQEVSHEELGGAWMHAGVSGTIDFREPDDATALIRIRDLAATMPEDLQAIQFRRQPSVPPSRSPEDLYQLVPTDPHQNYQIRQVLDCVVDAGSFQEYKAEYGKSLVCGYARLGGYTIGLVANQHLPEKTPTGSLQFGGVIYSESAEKAARFVMDCNQSWTPLVFLQDVYGFMVGREAEQSGIIKAGAKLVSAVANSRVPKLTVIIGGSYGAGHYALCGKAFDPRFLFAWPTASYAVMGSQQAAATLLDIQISALKRTGQVPDVEELEELRQQIVTSYVEQTDIRYSAARGWIDEIIEPSATRQVLINALEISVRHADDEPFRTGVYQV